MKIFKLFIIFLMQPTGLIAQNNLFIQSGHLKITEQVAVILNDCSIKNNGTFTATNGTVEIKGIATTGQSAISGTGNSIFHNLKINKLNNDVLLVTPIRVNNQLEMLSGRLDLGANNITLGSENGALIGETETSYITSTSTGQIIKTLDLNAPIAQNPGNLGIEITTTANLGSTEIRRGHDPQTVPSGTSIFRHFTITPTNNTGLDASLKFQYLEAELNGFSKTALVLIENNGGWMIDGFASRDTTNNVVSFAGYDGLYQYTLGANLDDPDMDGFSTTMDNCPNVANADQTDTDNDLVGDVCDACAHGDDLVDLNSNNIIDDCECQNSNLTLSGTLATNQNYIASNAINSVAMIENGVSSMYKAATSITLSAGFHAQAGSSFLGIIEPCITPLLLKEPATERLAKAMSTKINDPTLRVFPNPFVNQTTIEYTVERKGKVVLSVHDLMGQSLITLVEGIEQDQGIYTVDLNAQNLSAGMYILTIQNGMQFTSESLVVIDVE